MPLNKTLSDVAGNVHETLGTVMIIAIVLHTIGVLKHHFINKDKTLVRMLGKKID
ncbi:MAG: cytochrome b [Ostreibacterium sp.]